MISNRSAAKTLVDLTNYLPFRGNRCASAGAAVCLLLVGALAVPLALAKAPAPAPATEVSLAVLPSEAKFTHQLVLSGGPFPYAKDGTVFGNRERQLPAKARGFYREYTVKTPGSRDRGARRIVCGGAPPTQPESCFYTADHYASFRRITQ